MNPETELRQFAFSQALGLVGDGSMSYDDAVIKAMMIADDYIIPYLLDEYEWEIYASEARPPEGEQGYEEDLG